MVIRFFFYFPFFPSLLSPTRCLVSRTLWGGTVSVAEAREIGTPGTESLKWLPHWSEWYAAVQTTTLWNVMEWIGWAHPVCIFFATLVALCFCAGRISVKGWNKEGCSLHLQQGRHHTSNKFLEPLNSRLSIKRLYNRISLKWNKILQQFRAIFAKKITTVLLFCIWFFGRVFGIWECVLCNEDITDGVT